MYRRPSYNKRYAPYKKRRLTKAAGSYVQPKPGAELKFMLQTQAAVVSGPNVTPIFLNSVAGGNDSNQRAGRSITLWQLYLNFRAVCSATATGPCTTRIAVVYDKAPKGNLAAITDIYALGATGNVDVSSLRNLDNSQRFIVLFDKQFVVEKNPTPEGSRQHYGEVIPLLGLPTRFDSATGAIADCQAGSLLLIALADNSNTANTPRISYESELRFTDG